MSIPFQEFPKLARLSREVIITEKIDGTNASVLVHRIEPGQDMAGTIATFGDLALYAGSRTRWITPADDNFGFARWATEHAEELVKLGPGHHFGEWWGAGIQRRYGLTEKRFSLFNVSRWCLAGEAPARIPMADPRVEKYQESLPACCGLVPVLYRGVFTTGAVDASLDCLRESGSRAAPGFMKPEGVVVFHTAALAGFKKTLDHDGMPKSLAPKTEGANP